MYMYVPSNYNILPSYIPTNIMHINITYHTTVM